MREKFKKLNKNIILLFLGRMVSDMGSSIQMVIMPLYILDSGGTAATIGLFSFLALVPTLIVYPFSGVLADRVDRKKIMVLADVISGVVALTLAYLSFTGQLSMVKIMIGQAMLGALYGFFDPATKGMIPCLAEKESLNKVNSSFASLRILSGLLAGYFGVSIYATMGISSLFLINGISFLISAFTETFIQYKHKKKEITSGINGVLRDLKEGITFIYTHKVIGLLCTLFFVVFAFMQPAYQVALPLFFRTKLNYTDMQYAIIQAAFMIGALVGSTLVGLYKKETGLRKPLFHGLALVSISMAFYSLVLMPKSVSLLGNDTSLYFGIFFGAVFLLSGAMMFIGVPVQTFIQQATPDEYMSRVFSIVGMIGKAGTPFGSLIFGFVLNRVEIHWAVLAATFLMMISAVLFVRAILRKKIE